MDRPDGVYKDMSREEYDALERDNFSSVKIIETSPQHYAHAKKHGVTITDPLRLGTGVHTAVLEPQKFDAECVKWTGKKRDGKVWDAFELEHAGRTILTASEWEMCLGIQAAVKASAKAQGYLASGSAEVTILATIKIGGFEFKTKNRLDWVADLAGALVDLKSCGDAGKEAFGKSCFNYNYHVQAALYVDCFEIATGIRLPYRIIAVEKEAPYALRVFRIPEALIELGRAKYQSLFTRLGECRRDDHWPGYDEEETDLALPAWAVTQAYGELR